MRTANVNLTIPLPTLAATRELANRIAAATVPPMTIALNGTLGAGKTQWIRYFAEAIGVDADAVTSPTYVLLQRYRGRYPIYHFDFYRLDTPVQVWDLGIDELYEQPVVLLIEWADKFAACLPESYLEIRLELTAEEERTARIISHGTLPPLTP